MSVPASLLKLNSYWTGLNRLWLAPDEPVRVSEAGAAVSLVAQGKFMRIEYTWEEEDQVQSGSLLVGQANPAGEVQAVWIDNWHMGDAIMVCEGGIDASGSVAVQGTYPAPNGPDWGWRIEIEPGEEEVFIIRMTNISPDGVERLAVEATYSPQPKIEILPYQSRWPEEFRAIAVNLRQGLGPLALRIDHIGSTSVPGLAAKDVIDLQITVAALDQDLVAAMQRIGYTQAEGVWRDHRPASMGGPETDWLKWYFRPPAGQRRTHVHVRLQGLPNQRYPLLFRDYLRAFPAVAESYAELKRRLAESLADWRTYPEVKDPAVDLIYLPAEEWARLTHWEAGPSDA